MAESSNSDSLAGMPSLDALKRGDIAMAMGVVAILSVLFLPLPPFVLDFFLAISFMFSVLILLTVMFIEKPLQFNSFPTILLISTLLRLSLNVASTRLILGNGHEGANAAGNVIQAFGAFMMSDNFVIGLIVFAILVVVNFVVITKGSGRIAEVAARFSLDSMPGKQMAIDADLSSGLISESEAKQKRKDLEDESNFFGAMDGASKFVRGDAIAGLVITGINIIGGMIIGIVQRDMSAGDAAETYTLLSVGDGLVSQIPALIVSVAAGILVSKSGMRESTDKAVMGQLANYPGALGLSAFLLFILSFLPGMPMVIFWLIAAGNGTAAYLINAKKKKKIIRDVEDAQAAAVPPPVVEEPISKSLSIDHIRIELGYGLLPLINNPEGPHLTEQIKSLRRQLASEMGFVLPAVRIQDNMQLPSNTYVLRIKEIEAGRGDLRPGMYMCMDPRGGNIELAGEKTVEPTFGLPALWIQKNLREEAHFKGYTVVDCQTIITTHMTEIVRDHMSEMLSYTETGKLLEELDQEHQKLVSDIIPTQISIGSLQRVLQNLLNERISIRDLPTIMEGILEATNFTKSISAMTEHVRTRLARQLCDANINGAGVVPLLTLSPEWEQIFAESIVGAGDEKQLSMPPSQLQRFIGLIRQNYEQQAMQGETPVLLTSPQTRPFVRSIVERFRPQTMVMSQNEIHPRARIKTVGQI